MQSDRLLERVVGHGVEDRSEGLLQHDIGLRSHRRQRRPHVKRIGVLPLQDALAPLHPDSVGAGAFKCVLHAGKRPPVDQRADQRTRRERVAHVDLRIDLTQPRQQRLVDAALDDQAPQGRAALSRGSYRGEHDCALGESEIGGGRNDRRIVSTQLEDGAHEARRNLPSHGASHARGTGGGDESNLRLVQQHARLVCAPEHDLIQVRGHIAHCVAGALQQSMHGKGGERRLLRGLPQYGIAARQRQRRVPSPHRDRES